MMKNRLQVAQTRQWYEEWQRHRRAEMRRPASGLSPREKIEILLDLCAWVDSLGRKLNDEHYRRQLAAHSRERECMLKFEARRNHGRTSA